MVLSNSRHVLQAWLRALGNPNFRLALMRHAPKELNGGPEAQLSTEGALMATLLGSELSAIRPLLEGMYKVVLSSTGPLRNQRTIETVFCERVEIALPATDTFNCGPNNIDLVNARQLMVQIPIGSLDLALESLEEYGIERQGETPHAARERIAAGYVELMRRYPDRPVIHCMNSPTGNAAIGIYGMMEELETVFLSYHPGGDPPFQEIGRITPIFTD